MDPKKLRWIKLSFQGIHRFAYQMRTSAAVEFRIISRRRDPFDLVSKHNPNP
jgi:hypothetical protein